MTYMLKKYMRFFHTLRYLRPVQFYGRLWMRLYTPRADFSKAPNLRQRAVGWIHPVRRRPSLSAADTFEFLNQTATLSDVGWSGPLMNKIWRYNQPYFDDLNAADAPDRHEWHRALVAHWMQHNPAEQGDGWEPYPTSLRIVNWIKWGFSGHQLTPDMIQSLAVQARWLAKRLEIHLLGNHLFANAKALLFAGLYFEGAEAARWRKTALRLLVREVQEQIIPDGGHYEQSTMYHVLMIEDMLDILNLMQSHAAHLTDKERSALKRWALKIPAMLFWLKTMLHPDGGISFFNDAAFGVAPTPSAVFDYAQRLNLQAPDISGSHYLNDSGYARLENAEAVAILDMAKIGPDYLPGHAHADTLSFELSLFGQRVLVNSGTSQYGRGKERQRQRATPAHNTVTIDGVNSSDVWAGFRVGRRAYPKLPEFTASSACCSHDGYRMLAAKPVHHRCWNMGAGEFNVRDEIIGGTDHAVARFYFHPDIQIKPKLGHRAGVGTLPCGRQFRWQVSGADIAIENTTWHPEFGKSIPNKCLVVQAQNGKCELIIQWGTGR